MTPKEEADKIIDNFCNNTDKYNYADICVDNIIKALEFNSWEYRNIIQHYKEVQKEIEEYGYTLKHLEEGSKKLGYQSVWKKLSVENLKKLYN